MLSRELETIRRINLACLGIDFQIYLEPTLYDNTWWNIFESGNFEPDNLFILKKEISQKVVFFDVGAAVGAMTLIAAKLGAICIAYEPVGKWYDVLAQNVNLNIELKKQISIKKSVVSNISKPKNFLRNEVGKSISSIVYPENQDDISNLIDIKTEVLENCINEKPILKFDIEGAEYSILQDELFLRILEKKRAIIVLAIHPGFFRPIKQNTNFVIKKIAWLNFAFKNYIDNYRLYKKLNKFCKIMRCNNTLVSSAHKFCVMSAAGVYDYTLYF